MATYHYQQGDRPLDGYTIQYALGRGGFGEVYFAVSDSGREVALKAVQNFEEIELRGIGHCMNLKSPHLVMIFDVKRADDGTPWVIMEYVSGPSLREILDESPNGMDVDQTKFFLQELAKGLSYLHEAGVVHRDLKPHNVFFEDGIVKIGDYSLSKVITASHRSGNTMTVGSVHYMAPEISMGRYDKTVDIYALGVMLHEMLTGQPPYVGESMGEVLMKHLSSEPNVSQIPEPFAAAVTKAMQRDPADRFQTSQEMLVSITGQVAQVPAVASFNPSTLSMIGERSRQAKAQQAIAEPPPAKTRIASFDSLSTSPTSVHDTKAAPADAPVVQKQGLLQRFAIHYSPPKHVHTIPDPVPLLLRAPLALLVTFCLVTLGFFFVQGPYDTGRDQVLVALAVVTSFSTATGICCTVMRGRSGFLWSLASRCVWMVPWAIGLAFVGNLVPRVRDDEYAPVFCSLVICTFWLDWRCLATAHRHPRIAAIPTVFIGAIAVGFHLLFASTIPTDRTYLTPLTGALAIAAAITVQLVAPLRRAAPGAPLAPDSPIAPAAPPSPTVKRPRLLFDRTAIILELVVGAALLIAIAACATGDDELIAVGCFSGLVGFFALRFRLVRREGLTSAEAAPLNEYDPPVASIRPLDRMSVFLEALAVAAGGLLVVLMYWGDDDLIGVGAGAVLVGAMAIRLRLKRRTYLIHTEGSPALLNARTNPVRQQGFDLSSPALELFIGACVVFIAAVVIQGEDDLFGFAAAAAVAGIVALRVRLQGRHDARSV